MHEQHLKISKVVEQTWNNREIDLLSSKLAAEPLEWYEDVLSAPLIDRKEVTEQWQNDLSKQSDIKVCVILLDFVENRGYHRCKATWLDEVGNRHEVDAIFLITINENAEIASFRPWYSAKS